MNAVARLMGIGVIGLSGFGIGQLLTNPPDLPEPPPPVTPLPDTSSATMSIRLQPGLRINFVDPTGWVLSSDQVTEVWFCNGAHAVFRETVHVADVCGLALHPK